MFKRVEKKNNYGKIKITKEES